MMNLLRRYFIIVPFAAMYLCLTWHVLLSEPYDHTHDNRTPAPIVRPANDQLVTQAPGENTPSSSDNITPVLVLACNRASSLKRVLDRLFKLVSDRKYSVVISHDCNDSETEQVARSFRASYIQQPDQSRITVGHHRFNVEGYHRLCRHYRFALDQVVNVLFPEAETIVILEDDLDLSDDLFDYFDALRGMLLADDNVLCISGFNDNGKKENIDSGNPCRIWWTDFFPGLGWMTTTKIIRELLPKWPKAYWDDWLREPAQRKGRACIRPEVSKTTTFGKVGVSSGQYFDKHLAKILLNTEMCKYNAKSVEQAQRERYAGEYVARLETMEVMSIDSLDEHVGTNKSLKLVPHTLDEWTLICKKVLIMDDIRGGVARNSFMDAVPTMYEGIRLFVMQPPVN